MQNLKESVLKSFNFQEVRPVPYTVWYDSTTCEKLNKYYGNNLWQKNIKDHIKRITIDWNPKYFLSKNQYRDVYGTIWRKGTPDHIEKPILNEPSLKKIKIPSFIPYLKNNNKNNIKNAPWDGRLHLDLNETKKIIDKVKNQVFTAIDFGYGLFETCWIIRGYQDFMVDMIMEPRFTHNLINTIKERQLEVIDLIGDTSCDGIFIVDDYGDQRGIGMGADRWRTFFKKPLSDLYKRIHKYKKRVFHHSCGNVFEIIPDLIEINLDVLQSVQSEAMSIYKIKRAFGSQIRMWGGFSTQKILPFEEPNKIRQEVHKMKLEIGKNGGYVFSSSKPIMGEVPVENAVAFIEESINSEV